MLNVWNHLQKFSTVLKIHGFGFCRTKCWTEFLLKRQSCYRYHESISNHIRQASEKEIFEQLWGAGDPRGIKLIIRVPRVQFSLIPSQNFLRFFPQKWRIYPDAKTLMIKLQFPPLCLLIPPTWCKLFYSGKWLRQSIKLTVYSS